KLEDLAKTIPQVRENISAIERTILILRNGTTACNFEPSPNKDVPKNIEDEDRYTLLGHLPCPDRHSTNGHSVQIKTLEEIAIEALGEFGGEVATDQLIEKMRTHGCTSTEQSILGAIYRAMKKPGCPIKKVSPGVFALKENAPSVAS
ncbi:MAG: hypothetical protein KC588_18405, partial [Nitrospira sp.]|nr:hypothetical protein [Nitrospira sp.]